MTTATATKARPSADTKPAPATRLKDLAPIKDDKEYAQLTARLQQLREKKAAVEHEIRCLRPADDQPRYLPPPVRVPAPVQPSAAELLLAGETVPDNYRVNTDATLLHTKARDLTEALAIGEQQLVNLTRRLSEAATTALLDEHRVKVQAVANAVAALAEAVDDETNYRYSVATRGYNPTFPVRTDQGCGRGLKMIEAYIERLRINRLID